MTNMNMTSDFIFGASERELLTLSMAELIDGLMADYKGFSRGTDAGISIPANKLETRMAHACMLYAEGLRLAHTHLELARKLLLASLYDFTSQANNWFKAEETAKENGEDFDLLREIARFPHYSTRSFAWLKENGGVDDLEALLRQIKAFEDSKAKERKREE